MYINNDEQEYSLNIHYYGYEKDYSTLWYPIILTIICLTMLTIVNKDNK